MSRGNQAPVPLVDRRPAPPTVAERIRALGKTPAQVRAWAEQHDVPLPRHGVDEDAVTAYETAHPEDALCPTQTSAAATGTSMAPSSASSPPATTPGTPTASATTGEATTPDDGPALAGARRAAARATTVLPTAVPEQRAPVAIPIDGPDPVEMAELGGVILWPHPHRFPDASASAAPAPAGEDEDQYDTRLAVDIALADLEALGVRDPSGTPATTPPAAPPTHVVDIRQALAAARRLGGQGVPLPRLIDYVTAVDASLPTLPAPCVVCGETVTAEHITRTGQPVHGDPRTRTKCWDAYTERKTA